MLLGLSIRSFLLIDRLDLDAETGFTALTGETGAGKSIILEALGLVLGGQAGRAMVRQGCEQASISATFSVPVDHSIWKGLADLQVDADPDEVLTLRRTLSATGPSRAFLNDQPVASATLVSLGEALVEIHSQHAASALLRPSNHLQLLDRYAELDTLRDRMKAAWDSYALARSSREAFEAELERAREQHDWLRFAVDELNELASEPGEAKHLLAQRSALMQAERMTEAIGELNTCLCSKDVEDSLSKAARAADRLVRIEGLDLVDESLAQNARAACDAVERVLIELAEAQSISNALKVYDLHDAMALERIEARLLALRAVARKLNVDPDKVSDIHADYARRLAMCEAETHDLDRLKREERNAKADWRAKAETLSAKRLKGAKALECAIMKELRPLHLGRLRILVRFDPLEDDQSGAAGLETVEFEVETNPGSGFGPLRKIASGGELARFSLALKCALADAGGAQTLIFDEADQGVGGAVAAAIGERLAHLGADRQVFAITHSPQVASSASRQWRVRKQDSPTGHVVTSVNQLDDGQRLEEIARMLSGSSITDEARAAASKLLEVA
ncbi:MAG: DNA repair protein RecN [Pseudomonadota bacterium]